MTAVVFRRAYGPHSDVVTAIAVPTQSILEAHQVGRVLAQQEDVVAVHLPHHRHGANLPSQHFGVFLSQNLSKFWLFMKKKKFC